MYNAQAFDNQVVRQGDLVGVANVTLLVHSADADKITLRYLWGALKDTLWTLDRADFAQRRQWVCRSVRTWKALDRFGDPVDAMGTVVAHDATEAEIAFLTAERPQRVLAQWIKDGRLVR